MLKAAYLKALGSQFFSVDIPEKLQATPHHKICENFPEIFSEVTLILKQSEDYANKNG